MSSPHARGDVPPCRLPRSQVEFFSPRPWGCSARRRPEAARPGLLPTPVGMFRCCCSRPTRSATSPHARGDVPAVLVDDCESYVFSPRPWGCSAAPHGIPRRHRLLPTPVGMFHAASRSSGRIRPSPHARGDVPRTTPRKPTTRTFSPRQWGCSGHHRPASALPPLLPTPVGVFRHLDSFRPSVGESSV